MAYDQERRYVILSQFLGQDAYEYCLQKTDKRIADVLKGILDDKAQEFFNNVKYRKDHRTNEEFAKNLVMSRILEWYLIDYFKEKHNKKLFLDGADKNDVLDTLNVISNHADLKDENGTLIEVISDKFGYWNRNGGFDLRDNKYRNLLRKSEHTKVFILAVDMQNKRYQFIKVDKNLPAEKVSNIQEFGGKDGYHIDLDVDKYVSF